MIAQPCLRRVRHGMDALLVGLGLAFAAAPLAAQTSVVVTIKPLHSLVAGVMSGVGEPILLVRGAASPHGYTLRPSDIALLGNADLVVWVGASLETALRQTFNDQAERVPTVAVLDIPGMILRPDRRGTQWQSHEHYEEEPHGDETVEPETRTQAAPNARPDTDPHLWLDPVNAQTFVSAMVTALSRADPENARAFARNGRKLHARLGSLDREIGSQVEPINGLSYLVFHDAYQYFERRYRLSPAGSVTVHPEDAPTARRIVEIQRLVRGSEAKCIFSEPQFRSKMVQTLIRDTGAEHGTLDPIGLDLSPGPELYFSLLRNLAGSIVDCLGDELSG